MSSVQTNLKGKGEVIAIKPRALVKHYKSFSERAIFTKFLQQD